MPKLTPATITTRKSQILQASLTCFARSGYSRTTVDDIVREAGLSKGSIYTYYKSKKALYLALLEKLLTDTGLSPTLGGDTPAGRQRLNAALNSMIGFTTSPLYPAYSALLMDAWVQAQFDADIQHKLAENYAQLRALFTGLIEQSVASGEFNPVDGQTLANIFIAVFDGLMVQFTLQESAVDWQSAAETIPHSWLHGLLK